MENINYRKGKRKTFDMCDNTSKGEQARVSEVRI
jgi:hypothetical protein